MAEFRSWRSYRTFRSAIAHRTRYIHDAEVREFLDAVLGTHESRVESIPADSVLWRAQLGNDWRPIFDDDGNEITEEPTCYGVARMKPMPDRAHEGRANSKGIPCLYLATDRDTALAEVRPWVGSLVSVAEFRLKRSVRIVNCTSDDKRLQFYLKELLPQERERVVWLDIDRAFSQPVNPSDDVADYVSTQVLAELFKVNGLDGIGYRSSVGKGHNIAIFDPALARPVGGMVFHVKSVCLTADEVCNRCMFRESDKDSSP